MRALTALALRGAGTAALRASSVACAVSSVIAAARLVGDGGALPPAWAWLTWVALAGPAVAGQWAPAVGAWAAAAPLAEWRRSGGWTGLRAAGVGGRQLLAAWLVVGACTGVVTATAVHLVEPAARRGAERAVAWAGVRLVPGVPVALGGGASVVAAADARGGLDLLATGAGWVATARRGAVVGERLVAEDGRFLRPGDVPLHLAFARASVPIAAPSGRRDTASRWTPELAAAARRTEAAGRSAAYEWAMWWKRWLWPCGAAVAPVAFGPLGASTHGARWALLGAASVLLAVRAGDRLAGVLPPAVAAACGPAILVALGLVVWARWADR